MIDNEHPESVYKIREAVEKHLLARLRSASITQLDDEEQMHITYNSPAEAAIFTRILATLFGELVTSDSFAKLEHEHGVTPPFINAKSGRSVAIIEGGNLTKLREAIEAQFAAMSEAHLVDSMSDNLLANLTLFLEDPEKMAQRGSSWHQKG